MIREPCETQYRRLFEKHRPLVVYVLNGYLRPAGLTYDVSDLANEVFLKGSGRYREGHEGTFKPWITRIAANYAIDHLRRNKIRTRFISNCDLGVLLDMKPSNEATPEDMLIEKDYAAWRQGRLRRAIERLPEDQRVAIRLRFLEDWPFAAIGRHLDIPENTVKSRVRYALEKLRDELADLAADFHGTPVPRAA